MHRACFVDGWSRSDLAHLLALPGGFGLLARCREGGFPPMDSMRSVGFAVCRVVRDESELLTIGVLPSFRRRRIGRALLEAAMQRCLDSGASRIFLEVATDNHDARQLYERNGFSTVGTRPEYYKRPDGSRAHAYTMVRELKRSDETGDGTAPLDQRAIVS